MEPDRIEKLESRVLSSLARYGPLCVSQIYTILDLAPQETQEITRSLYQKGLIEEVDEPIPAGVTKDLRVYGIPTGRGRRVGQT